jgi:serine/threonine-protein kinase
VSRELPEQIGGYEILDEIGRGGMGVVYLGLQASLDRLVAVKVVEIDDAELARRLTREARILADIQHPHIVSVLDVGDDGRFPFYVMAYCAGGSLAQVLERDRRLPAGQASPVLAVVSEALAAMHGHGLVHRDVKPSNVLLSADGEPYLSDFGVAMDESTKRITTRDAVLGTIGYAAPELLAGGRVTPAADVFSLGVMGYQLLAGELPFRGAHIFGVMEAVRTGSYRPLAEAAPDAPEPLVALITACLQPAPSERPSDLRGLAAALRASSPPERLRPVALVATSDETRLVRRTGEPASLKRTLPGEGPRRRRALALIPAAALVGVLALLGGLLVANRGDGPGESAGSTSTPAGVPVSLPSGPEAGLAGLSATRSWTADGTAFTSVTEVRNTAPQPVTSYHAEVVPKGIATSAAALTFQPLGARTLKDDPIVAWDLVMEPGATTTLTYRATLTRPLTQADLEALEAERAVGYRALLEFIAAQGGAAQTQAPDLATFTPPTLPAGPPVSGGPDPTGPTSTAPPPAPSTSPTTRPFPSSTTTTTAPLPLPGAVRDLLVSNPSGDDRTNGADLAWSSPATGGGQISAYRIRRTTYGSTPSCGDPTVVVAGPVDVDTPGPSLRVTAQDATRHCQSWIRWEVAAVNRTGVGPFTAATGIVPDVRGRPWAYHLVRTVGGRSAGTDYVSCGVAPYAGCSTSLAPGTRIQDGTAVTIFEQGP